MKKRRKLQKKMVTYLKAKNGSGKETKILANKSKCQQTNQFDKTK